MSRQICGREWAGADTALVASHRCKLDPGHEGDCVCMCGASADLSYYRDEKIYDSHIGGRMLIGYLAVVLAIAVLAFAYFLSRAIIHGGF